MQQLPKRDSQPTNMLKATNISEASEILSGLELGEKKKDSFHGVIPPALASGKSLWGCEAFFSYNLPIEPAAFRTAMHQLSPISLLAILPNFSALLYCRGRE